jgi:hypothetical protein
VRVETRPAQLASIRVSPDTVAIAPSASFELTALPSNQYGFAFPSGIEWSVSGGGDMAPLQSPSSAHPRSTFISNGTEGDYIVTASSGTVTATAVVQVTTSVVASISVSSPGPGDTVFHVGDTLNVRWSATTPVAGIIIYLSVDGGLSFTSILGGGSIVRGDPEWGEFRWVIPDSLMTGDGMVSCATDDAQVRICLYGDCNEVVDYSGAFIIRTEGGEARRNVPFARRGRIDVARTPGGESAIGWSGAGTCRIRVVDVSGRLCAEETLGRTRRSMLLSRLQKGVYVLNAITAEGTFSRVLSIVR